MSRKNSGPAPDPFLERTREVLANPAFAGNPLLEPYRELADRYAHMVRTFMKTVSISDSYQLRLKELNEVLDEAMRTDYLTGLMNRRAFFDRVRPELSRSRRHQQPLCIIMGDIDRFKAVNDLFGHDVGDKVLQETARTFSSALRTEDLKVRWGGEEFLALLPETDAAGAAAAAEKLRSLIEQTPFKVAGNTIHMTISIGISEERGEDPEAAIRAADQALLEAKRTGRNRVVVASGQASSSG
jgi:diguanylate cyclase (GGDEF)-like protein